jgi:shikimate kinase
MSKHRNFFLVGLMAVGKSTVGRCLAEELKLPFFDSDRVIEERAGADVAWIFDVEGEAGFREREVQVIDELTACDGIVLATGGGVVMREENRRRLSERGTVIFLDTTLSNLVERTRRDRRRPLLQQSKDPMMTFERLEAERRPLYEAIADYRFFANRGSASSMAREIARQLRNDGYVQYD